MGNRYNREWLTTYFWGPENPQEYGEGPQGKWVSGWVLCEVPPGWAAREVMALWACFPSRGPHCLPLSSAYLFLPSVHDLPSLYICQPPPQMLSEPHWVPSTLGVQVYTRCQGIIINKKRCLSLQEVRSSGPHQIHLSDVPTPGSVLEPGLAVSPRAWMMSTSSWPFRSCKPISTSPARDDTRKWLRSSSRYSLALYSHSQPKQEQNKSRNYSLDTSETGTVEGWNLKPSGEGKGGRGVGL